MNAVSLKNFHAKCVDESANDFGVATALRNSKMSANGSNYKIMQKQENELLVKQTTMQKM